MKISTKGRYALRMLLDLARCKKDGFVTLAEIAARQEISRKYLEQIVLLLGKSGILSASRGYLGGYRLAKKPEEIRLSEVLCLTEGSLAPVACLENSPNQCARCGDCEMLPVWEGLENVIYNYLDGVTLADILKQEEDGLVPK